MEVVSYSYLLHTTNPLKWFHIPTFYTYNLSMTVVSYSYLLHTTNPLKWFHIPTYYIQPIHVSGFIFLPITYNRSVKVVSYSYLYTYNQSMKVVSYSYLLHTTDPWKWFHIHTYYIHLIHGSGFIFIPITYI